MGERVIEKQVRIIMWCVPRSISSAISKCLSFIEGNEIWFEPFSYAHIGRELFRKKRGEDLPMEYETNEEKFAEAAGLHGSIAQSKIEPNRISFKNVKERLGETMSKYVFVKDMGFSVADEKTRQYLPSGYKHVFLIRHPFRVIHSYRQAIFEQLSAAGYLQGDASDAEKFHVVKDDFVLEADGFFSSLHDLWLYIKENIDPDPVVLNADDLLTNPAKLLAKFCEQTGLPYSDSLLHWDASTDIVKQWKTPGDTLTTDAVAFYGTAMKSSEFLPPCKPKLREELTDDVLEIAEAAMPFFSEMNKYRIL